MDSLNYKPMRARAANDQEDKPEHKRRAYPGAVYAGTACLRKLTRLLILG